MPPRLDINIKITTPVDHMREFQEAIRNLRDNQVLVGIPAANAGRDDGKGDVAKPPINNAALLYIHDKGAPEVNIPARPVVDPGINDKKVQIEGEMQNAGRLVLSGRDPHDALARTGMVAVNGIKARITSNTPPSLAKSTIRARQRRGITRINTLVDKGKMLNAVTYVVRKRGR